MSIRQGCDPVTGPQIAQVVTGVITVAIVANDQPASLLSRRLRQGIYGFEQPVGGLFFWARLTGANGKLADASVLAKRAIEQLVAFVPGAPFFAEKPDLATLRLSFATANLEKIEEGIARLGKAL